MKVYRAMDFILMISKSTDYEEEILNISEIYSEFNISALPNPFINQITISTSEISNFEITLFDMQGRMVSETIKTKNGTIEIKNLDTLTTGIYFATVVTEVVDQRPLN